MHASQWSLCRVALREVRSTLWLARSCLLRVTDIVPMTPSINRSDLKDPMLHAAAEGIASPDHLRLLSYADDELARLRDRLNLPTPSSYSQGRPNYAINASPKALMMVAAVEERSGGRFAPSDARAIAEVFDEVLTAVEGCASAHPS